jgi:hypothetical protein
MQDRDIQLDSEFSIWMQTYYEQLVRKAVFTRRWELDFASAALVNLFDHFADRFCEHETIGNWEKWIRAEASLVWQYKDCPANQSPDRELDDWMQAKRLLGYLVAEHLLAKTREGGGQCECPLDLLRPERAKYLLALSVDEFVRFRAYFGYRSRISKNGDDVQSQHLSDYDMATGVVYEGLRDLLLWPHQGSKCRECGRSLSQTHEKSDAHHLEIEQIKVAKKRALRRLGLGVWVDRLVDRSVDSLYPWLRRGASTSPPSDPPECLCTHFASVNMFEFFVMCAVAHGIGGDPFEKFPRVPRPSGPDHNKPTDDVQRPPI